VARSPTLSFEISDADDVNTSGRARPTMAPLRAQGMIGFNEESQQAEQIQPSGGELLRATQRQADGLLERIIMTNKTASTDFPILRYLRSG